MWFAVPLGRYVPHRKEQQLEERIVGREHSPCLSDLPQLPVEALYGIGGIDQAPHLIGVLKEGCQLIPVVPPAFNCCRILLPPFRIECIKLLPCFILRIRLVDFLEVRDEALHVL